MIDTTETSWTTVNYRHACISPLSLSVTLALISVVDDWSNTPPCLEFLITDSHVTCMSDSRSRDQSRAQLVVHRDMRRLIARSLT